MRLLRIVITGLVGAATSPPIGRNRFENGSTVAQQILRGEPKAATCRHRRHVAGFSQTRHIKNKNSLLGMTQCGRYSSPPAAF